MAMFQPKLQLLRTHDIDTQLEKLFSRWEATEEERLAFIDWAMDTATASELVALANPALVAAHLRVERDFAHRLIAEQLHQTSTIDLQLVSKRMFFEWLSGQLEPMRIAA